MALRSGESLLPRGPISHNCIENGQEFTRDSDDGDLLGLASRDEPVVEGLEHWVVLLGNYGTHKEDPAHARPPTTDEAFASPLTRLPREGSNTHKRRDFLAVEPAKLRQVC